MKKSQPKFIFLSSTPKIPETNVVIEEISSTTNGGGGASNDQHDETVTEAENVNPLSKTKLSKMSPDDLKNLCIQRGLSGEGTKKILIDRLLGITRD